MATSTCNVTAAIKHAREVLGINYEMKPKQIEAIESYLRGEDTFVNLPTGHGKSLIYQAAPFCKNYQEHRDKSIAIIISPLVALMRDQVKVLQARGVPAAYIADVRQNPTEKRKLFDGDFALVFGSPETLVGPFGLELLTCEVYQDNICGFFVDEGHCVAKWGYKSGKVKAFRECYRHLAELRSLVPSSVPMMVLTATASPDVKSIVITTLGMSKPYCIEISPERPNIRYAVISVQTKSLEKQFKWLIEELQHNQSNCRKVLIFCRSHRHCRELYATFEELLGDELASHIAMFHSCTEEARKELVLQDFSRADGRIRLLIATAAFGMGVHVQGLYTVIHYGPSKDLSDYFQESGRIGRDGKQSFAVILLHPRCLLTCRVDENMKAYLNTRECRRKLLLEHYGHSVASDIEKNLCCDNCADGVSGAGWVEEQLMTVKPSSESSDKEAKIVRQVTAEQKQQLREQILAYRDTQLQGEASAMYSGVDMASGLALSVVDSIVKGCHTIRSLEHLQNSFPFFSGKHAQKVWELISETLGHEFQTAETQEQSSSSSVSEEEYLDAVSDGSSSAPLDTMTHTSHSNPSSTSCEGEQ